MHYFRFCILSFLIKFNYVFALTNATKNVSLSPKDNQIQPCASLTSAITWMNLIEKPKVDIQGIALIFVKKKKKKK